MKKLFVIFGITTALVLAGCDDTNKPVTTTPANETNNTAINDQAAVVNDAVNDKVNNTVNNAANDANMDHSSSGELPSNLKKADNPKYPVGSKATIKTDHMAGMNGAEATIVGAFDTVAYAVTYTPTTGGDKVEDHKWIIHEEIVDAKDSAYKKGDKVMTSADHMNGMANAEVTIDSVKPTTVYMVDYKDTKTGEPVNNHQWVTEDELSK